MGRYVDLPHERALPVHLIFDDKLASSESVASQWLSWPITTEGYVWSADNSAEIEKGWIIKADSIEELAEKINRDPAEVKATIDRYNAMVEAESIQTSTVILQQCRKSTKLLTML